MAQDHDPASGSHARSSGGDETTASPALPAAGPLAADPLSDVLRAVRLTGALFFLWDVSWPFATPVPNGAAFAPIVLPGAQQIVSYHIVLEGSAWGAVPGGEPVELGAGDILLVPRGDAYVMSSRPGACVATQVEEEASLGFFRQMAAGELPFVVKDGGGEAQTTRVVCGFLGCDDRPFNPVLAALPPLVRLRAPASGPDRLRGLIDLALAESRDPHPGSRAALLRLSELMFVEVIRRCVAQLPAADGGWLAALGDAVAGPALVLLHKSPEEPWSLDRLAARVGISRSQLAERFARTVGEPPMQYLTRWRMQLATRLLSDGGMKVASVAQQVGYGSEAAFSRAFKRCVGVSPALWRRQAMR